MQRKFELASVLDDDVVDTIRFNSLERAQDEPWGDEPYLYRVISELEVPENPLMEPLVLNVWHQSEEAAEWLCLTD